jgi:thiol-disulfide isomerase/thioredoxin
MIRIPFAAALAVLLAHASLATISTAAPAPVRSTTKAAAARPALSARALVDSVCAHYARLTAYRFSGLSISVVTGDSMPMPMRNEIPFLFAAVRPGRLHNEIDHPVVGARIVSDGDSIVFYSPNQNQYSVQPAPMILAGSTPTDPQLAQLQPLLSLAMLGRDVSEVEDRGRDTVRTSAGPIVCRRLLLRFPIDPSHGESVGQEHVLWVDEARRLVLRDSTLIHIDRSMYGPVRNQMTMRFVLADDQDGGPDSLYRRMLPDSAVRVVPAASRMPAPPALEGKDAADFTLAGLDGKKVTLSALRGKVVVLDFWATWCGPCRRWMPIVAKLEGEMKGRGVQFFAVNVGESPAKVRQFLRAAGVTVPVLLDPEGEVGERYGAHSIPLTVVVGRDGKVASALLGLHPESDLRAALETAGVAAK